MRRTSNARDHQVRVSWLLFYDAVYPDTVGGVEHRNHQIAQALAARGHRVVLAGWTTDTESSAPGVIIRSIGSPRNLYRGSGKRSRLLAFRLAWNAVRIDLSDIDVVETANIPYLHLFPLSIRCRRARIPLIVTWHEFWGRYWRTYTQPGPFGLGMWRLYRWIEKRAAGLGDHAVAVSQMTAQRVAAARGETIEVVPNGLPLARLYEAVAQGRAAATSTAPLVYAGRLIESKRLSLLIDAAAELAPSIPGPILMIIGDGPMRLDLQDQIQRLGLVDRVEMTGRLESSDEVWQRMSGARIAVQPSVREGFGMFPLEAMAMGLPVIHCASPESAVGETVRHGIDGIQVAATPAAIAGAIRDLLDNEERRATMAIQAIERASMFDWNKITGSLERIWAG